MNKKKAILAIFMMAFLIIIGFILPSIWKSQKGNKKDSDRKQDKNLYCKIRRLPLENRTEVSWQRLTIYRNLQSEQR